MAKKADEKIKLKVEKRELFGRKVKRLRREGKIPANIYGRDFTSTAITTDAKDFFKVYKQAGKTQVVYLELEGKEMPALVANIQYHPIDNTPLHIDFKKVDLKKKVEAEVPVKVIGSSPAVEEKGAELIVQSTTLLVSALPDKLPSQIEVDISQITEPGVEIKVKDLKAGKDYEIVDEPEKTVLIVAEHTVEEVEEKPAEEEEKKEEEKKPEEEKASEEKKEEKKE